MNVNEQLLNNFTKQLHKNLKRKKTEKSPDICQECGDMTHVEMETREGGNFELIRYCEGCGATQIT